MKRRDFPKATAALMVAPALVPGEPANVVKPLPKQAGLRLHIRESIAEPIIPRLAAHSVVNG